MNIEEFVRVIKSLGQYSNHPWIDFQILPGIACSILEEFPELDRSAALEALDADSEEIDGWSKGFSDKVRKYFGPRYFIVAETGEGRIYYSLWRMWVSSIEEAARFDSEADALEFYKGQHGPPLNKVLAVPIPHPQWLECENPA